MMHCSICTCTDGMALLCSICNGLCAVSHMLCNGLCAVSHMLAPRAVYCFPSKNCRVTHASPPCGVLLSIKELDNAFADCDMHTVAML